MKETFNAEDSLETTCTRCEGTGGETERGVWQNCYECNGSGYVPTELGQKIVALMRHNIKPTLSHSSR